MRPTSLKVMPLVLVMMDSVDGTVVTSKGISNAMVATSLVAEKVCLAVAPGTLVALRNNRAVTVLGMEIPVPTLAELWKVAW